VSSRPKFPLTDVLIALSVPILLIVSSFWIEPDETRIVVLATGIVTAVVLAVVGLKLTQSQR
jgi:hypothetical protein